MKKVLITGGSGYIGSHIISYLLKSSFQIINFDLVTPIIENEINFTNIKGDICDTSFLISIFQEYKPDYVIHLAALTNVEESELSPESYYFNNTFGTLSVLNAMQKSSTKNLIFSSTAAVYDLTQSKKFFCEEDDLDPMSVYGKSKLFSEKIILDFSKSHNLNYVIFRFFNVIGIDITNQFYKKNNNSKNLLPVIVDVLNKQKNELLIFGNDYETPDGTAIRDYIHVLDIVKANLKAIDHIDQNKNGLFNLGSGKGYSVLEVVNMFENISQVKIKKRFVDRRVGDGELAIASSKKANEFLNWNVKANYMEKAIQSLISGIEIR